MAISPPIAKGRLLFGGRIPVKVSARSACLKFISCGPVCIAKGCKSRCCDAPTHPSGTRIYVHPSEEKALRKRGAVIKDGFLLPREGEHLCPFKTAGHLCGLFELPERPLGCIVSPFMINSTGTLIIRNRYKLLPCYDTKEGQPAYQVFASSLTSIFGSSQATTLQHHLDRGLGDLTLTVDPTVYEKLTHREEALHERLP